MSDAEIFMISSASRGIYHIAMSGGQQELRVTLAHTPPTLSGERKAIEVTRRQLREVQYGAREWTPFSRFAAGA
jgi:hypothetical protein